MNKKIKKITCCLFEKSRVFSYDNVMTVTCHDMLTLAIPF